MTTEVFESYHKVRTFECDTYGHVNNATYLNFLEFARMEVLEKKELSLDLLKEMGFLLVIRRLDITYRTPAVPGDRLVIQTRLKGYRNTCVMFQQKIFREADNKVIAEADVTWVTINPQGRPVRIPLVLKKAVGIH